MAQVSNNENNRFTKECIYEALWEVIKHQEYNTITITQIANKAGVSRNAIIEILSLRMILSKKDFWSVISLLLKK